MRIKPLLALVIAFSLTVVKAQKTDKALLVVQYNFKHIIDTTQRDRSVARPYALVLGTDMSNYDNYYSVMSDRGTPVKTSRTDPSTGRVIIVTMGGFGGEHYVKDFSSKKFTTIDYLGDSKYAIEEPLPTMEWNVVNEQKIIKEYKCQKATTFFKGRNYTAWFTDQLPYRNGPWKLGGLPGLILEANDDNNEVVFECTSIMLATDDDKPIKVPGNVIAVDPIKFKKTQDAIKNDAKALVGASAVRTASNISARSVPMPGMEGLKELVLNNPIEK